MTNTVAKKKPNLKKLLSKMDAMSCDAIDREVVKRFKILIETSNLDIPKTMLDEMLKSTKNIDISSIDENIQPYIRHFLLMLKRETKNKP
jgi:hypothetical protein